MFRFHGNSKLGFDFLRKFAEISRRREREERDWVRRLQAKGVRAAHPDDGWVDRTNRIVTMMNPYYDDGIAKGDIIVLGDPDKWRCVRVIFKLRSRVYGYEEVG